MQKKRKILITGSDGNLAKYVDRVFDDELIFSAKNNPYKIALDITDGVMCQRVIEEIQPDYVFHLASVTDVDLCETDSNLANQVNFRGVVNIAQACKRVNATLVFISSGAVFSGEKKSPYIESDDPNPVNMYGKTKLYAEQYIKANLKRYYILRAGWLFGGGIGDKKFVGKIVKQLRSGVSELKIVDDKYGSPTYSLDFWRLARQIFDSEMSFGIYHVANHAGLISRFDIAKQILEVFTRRDIILSPVSSKVFNLSAPRGTSEAIISEKLPFLKIRTWEEALTEYLENEVV